VLAVALLALVPASSDEELRSSRIDFETAAQEFNAAARSGDAAPTTTVAPATPATDAAAPTTTAAIEVPPVPRILTFGDSTALLVALGLRDYQAENGLDSRVGGSVQLGCPVARFEALQQGRVIPVEGSCRDWGDRWPKVLAEDHADIAQLVTGTWDVADGRMPGASGFAGLGDPATDDFVRSELLAAVDTLSSSGALVVMVLWPEVGSWADDGQPASVVRQMDPARMQRMHELQREVAAQRPDTVRILDFAGWFGDRAQDQSLRADGVHVEESEMLRIYEEWMGAETARLWDEWWQSHRSARALAGAPTTTTVAPPSLPEGTTSSAPIVPG
jgi:hypothetical protein